MWNPTHIQLTVGGCRDLIKKGKAGTNDAYVLIKCGSSRYQTSVRERSVDPSFNEKCEFALKDDPKCIKVKVYHRNFLGSDVLLGLLNLSLAEICLNISSNRRDWYRLTQKDLTKSARKYFGEIELFLSLGVQSQLTASRTDLNKKVPHPIRSVAKTIGNMFHPKNNAKSSSTSSPSTRSERLDMFLRSQSCLDVSMTRGKELVGGIRRRMVEQIEEEVETPDSEEYKVLSGDNELPSGEYKLSSGEYKDPSGEFKDPSGEWKDLSGECKDPSGDSIDKSTTILLESDELNNDDVFADFLADVPLRLQETPLKGSTEKNQFDDFWKVLEETPVLCANQKKSMTRIDNSSLPLTEEQFFDSLLNTSSHESRGTQTANGISRKVSVGCQVSLENVCQDCISYEEKLREKEDSFPQKQELLNLLNKQKNEITKNEKRIAELEEYIDNMLAKVLESQPQLLTSSSFLMSDRKITPVTPPICNKDIESFMKHPVLSDDDEIPVQNRSSDSYKSVFF